MIMCSSEDNSDEDGHNNEIKTSFFGNIVAISIGVFLAYWIVEGSRIAIFLAILLIAYVIYANLD